MQPLFAAIAVTFIAGLSIRTWNLVTFALVALCGVLAAGVLYAADGYM